MHCKHLIQFYKKSMYDILTLSIVIYLVNLIRLLKIIKRVINLNKHCNYTLFCTLQVFYCIVPYLFFPDEDSCYLILLSLFLSLTHLMIEKVLFLGQIFEMEILVDLHDLSPVESENYILNVSSVCMCVCVSVCLCIFISIKKIK